MGSSPLARGLHDAPPVWSWSRRIIPARAGFTLAGAGIMRRSPDHPRSRGVYALQCAAYARADGSSPLARGLLDAVGVECLPGGIIPARAGFTAPLDHGLRRTKDHPRSRGVYRKRGAASAAPSGSSPLARGLLGDFRDGMRWGGIIPARAGFTIRRLPTRTHRRDHPRSRGVYPACRTRSPSPPGSSPLARGLLALVIVVAAVARIIPARAGFTSPNALVRRESRDHPRSRGVYAFQSASEP